MEKKYSLLSDYQLKKMCQDNLKAFYEIFKREDFIKNEDIFCPTSFIVSTFESDEKTCKHHNQVIVIPF